MNPTGVLLRAILSSLIRLIYPVVQISGLVISLRPRHIWMPFTDHADG